MELLDAQKIQLFFIFAVPGMIALYVRAQFLDGKIPDFKVGLATYVAISLIYHAIWFLIAPGMYAVKVVSANGCEKVGWVFIEFIGPAILGVVSGINVRKQWLRKFLAKFGLTTVHPVASAWDWKFSGVPESWVLVVLKDGKQWGGVLSEKSFISSTSKERDIFIEKVYEIKKSGKWVGRDSGVLITHQQIQTIEFWPKG
ncbi:DUF6338 family protein [Silvimonas sp.]|uniref:DUF6338 family protein n=1 Tax=Silvimonas sp. TaxID=2650811 RepID=UPI00285098A0|nr:DUF6338 family protein [Silvimonas sp.]MDR3427765.1 DUF6338 family protein [Silvimonas sp.]